MFVAQTLSEPNPAAHAIWWVAGAIALLLGVLVLLEVVDMVRYRSTKSSRGSVAGPDTKEEPFRYKEPTSEVRRRFFRRPVAKIRSWKDGLIEPGRNRDNR